MSGGGDDRPALIAAAISVALAAELADAFAAILAAAT